MQAAMGWHQHICQTFKEASQQIHEVAYCIHFTDGLNWESMKFQWLDPMRDHWQSWEQKLSHPTPSQYWQEQPFSNQTLNLAYKIVTSKKYWDKNLNAGLTIKKRCFYAQRDGERVSLAEKKKDFLEIIRSLFWSHF